MSLNLVTKYTKSSGNKSAVGKYATEGEAEQAAKDATAYQAKKLKALVTALLSDVEDMPAHELEFAIIDIYSSLVSYQVEIT